MTCVTLSLYHPWSDSTSPMLCSKDRSRESCVICYLWKTLTASQVRKACPYARVVKGNQMVGKAESKVAMMGISIFPGPYCMGFGNQMLKHYP